MTAKSTDNDVVYIMLPVSLDCPFFNVSLVFFNNYYLQDTTQIKSKILIDLTIVINQLSSTASSLSVDLAVINR
jgi:hypothetical protein